jgi:hypothetical protein
VNKPIKIIIILLVIIAVGIGGYFGYRLFVGKKNVSGNNKVKGDNLFTYTVNGHTFNFERELTDFQKFMLNRVKRDENRYGFPYFDPDWEDGTDILISPMKRERYPGKEKVTGITEVPEDIKNFGFYLVRTRTGDGKEKLYIRFEGKDKTGIKLGDTIETDSIRDGEWNFSTKKTDRGSRFHITLICNQFVRNNIPGASNYAKNIISNYFSQNSLIGENPSIMLGYQK